MQQIETSHFEFDEKLMETETTTRSEFPNGGKGLVEQIPASDEKNKSKFTVMDPTRKVNLKVNLSKVT